MFQSRAGPHVLQVAGGPVRLSQDDGWAGRVHGQCTLTLASVPPPADLSTGLSQCPHNLAAGFTQGAWAKTESRASCAVF